MQEVSVRQDAPNLEEGILPREIGAALRLLPLALLDLRRGAITPGAGPEKIAFFRPFAPGIFPFFLRPSVSPLKADSACALALAYTSSRGAISLAASASSATNILKPRPGT
jgi:hypothetical protein